MLIDWIKGGEAVATSCLNKERRRVGALPFWRDP